MSLSSPPLAATRASVSFLANGDTGSQIVWSKDGKYLVFDTSQRSEDTHIVRVDLLPHVPRYREDEFRDLFKPDSPDRKSPAPGRPPGAPPAQQNADAKVPEKVADAADKLAEAAPVAPKAKIEPVRIVFDGIRGRATLMPLEISAENPLISPDGKTLVFRTELAHQTALYSFDLDELARDAPVPQHIVSSQRPKRFAAFTPDSKQLYYLDAGTVTVTPLENPRSKPVPTEELDVVFDHEKVKAFDQAWSLLNRMFFDASFNGKDWSGLRDRWLPYIEGAHTSDEMRRLTNLMIGELNASHSGINRGPPGPAPRVADLGVRFAREPYEAGKGLVVREVRRTAWTRRNRRLYQTRRCPGRGRRPRC